MLWLGGIWRRVNAKLLQQGEMEEAGGKDGADEVQPLPQGSVFGDSTEADLRLPDTWDLTGMVLGTGGAPCSGSLDLMLVEPGVDPSEPLSCCVFLCHSLTLSGLSFPTSIA